MKSYGILPMPKGISADNIIGAGTSGMCFRYSGTDRVIKIPLTEEEERDRCQVEAEVYERLQNLPGRPSSILHYYGKNQYGIELAYASHGSVPQYRAKQGPISDELLYRWADQASEALAFCHACDILHADINCRNFFVDDLHNLLLADFAGSSVDQKEPLVYYSSSHQRPNDSEGLLTATVQTEIFAFGSFLYELVTGVAPAATDQGLTSLPDVSNILLGAVMLGCWKDEFQSMVEVRREIREDTQMPEIVDETVQDVPAPESPPHMPFCPAEVSPFASSTLLHSWKPALVTVISLITFVSLWHRFSRR